MGKPKFEYSRIILTLSLSLLFAVAQSSIFRDKGAAISEDSERFMQTLYLKLQNYNNDYTTEFYKKFNSFWLSEILEEEDRKTIVMIADLLDKRKMSTVPFMTSYLESVMSFFSPNSHIEGFVVWNNSIPKLLDRKDLQQQDILFTLESPLNLNQKHTLYASNSLRWEVDTARYVYQYDTTLFVRFDQTTLKCHTSIDSFAVNGTSGIYFPFTHTFRGNGGNVYWKNAGYDSSAVYAQVSSYKVDLGRRAQMLDSCMFFFKGIINEPIAGKVLLSTDNISNIEKTYYPQFTSDSRNISITNLFDSVDFVGGLALKGHSFIGYGTKAEPAKMTFIKAKKPFITARSSSFLISQNILQSNNASISIRLVDDSIVHSNKIFYFDNSRREVRLTTEFDRMLTRAPFMDSYHQIGIYSEQLYWNMNSNVIRFNAPVGGSGSDAIFESFNFFNHDMFNELQRHDSRHPILAIRRYERSVKKGNPLTCNGFSKFIRYSNAEVDALLKEMAFLGYIIYDEESRVFSVTRKMRDALKASGGQMDFDTILFKSEAQNNRDNAILDLSNFNLEIQGIPVINLSDSQNVRVYPRNNKVRLKQNRDMEFDGMLIAGLVSFSGEGFEFNYNQFNVNIDKVVSMNFEYRTDSLAATGERALNAITSTIEKIRGVLQIDDPNNKSGLKSNPHYPKFKSITDSYIYYDQPSNFGGVYKRDNFYFRLYPYELDSLNNFESKNLDFKGEFVSDDIFAPFEYSISVQPDQSFGFVRKLDSTGISMYKGKGQFFNSVKLSNKGLVGKGYLEYINSTSYSDLFLFFPDTTLSNLSSVKYERQMQGIEYPNGNSKAHLMRWFPKRNLMNFYKSEFDFNFYDNQVTFNGNLKLEPLGLSGDGLAKVDLADITSPLFEFAGYSFASPSANTIIYNNKRELHRFKTDSVATEISLVDYTGKFSKPNSYFKMLFPTLEYMAYGNEALWKMRPQTIDINTINKLALNDQLQSSLKLAYEGKTPSGSIFISTQKEQDSLCFASTKGYYEMSKDLLSAYKVPHMLLGDAALLLNSPRDTVQISSGAKMSKLFDTDLWANRENKNLHFYDVEMNVGGRNGFLGIGNYTYKDMYGKEDTIRFSTITLNKEYKTTAFADILEEDKFFLSPYFEFKGKATAFSENKHLEFDGGFRLVHQYKKLPLNWMRFKALINPDSVLIPMEVPYKAINDVRVYAGTHVRRDSVTLYPTFFTGRKYTIDTAMVQPSGYLYHNDNGDFYQLSSMEKIRNNNSAGNLISLYRDPSINLITNEGLLNLSVKLDEVQMAVAGKSMQKIDTNDFTFNGIIALDFLFNNEALNAMTSEIVQYSTAAIDFNSVKNKQGLKELVGDSTSIAIADAFSKNSAQDDIAKELAHTIVLTDLTLKWDPKGKSFVSNTYFGIANVNGKPVNKRVRGYLELIPLKDKRLYLYLDLGDGKYYVFVYTSAGNMYGGSSNALFNMPIDKTKSKKRSIKRGLWNTTYIYTNATDAHKEHAFTRYNEIKAMEIF